MGQRTRFCATRNRIEKWSTTRTRTRTGPSGRKSTRYIHRAVCRNWRMSRPKNEATECIEDGGRESNKLIDVVKSNEDTLAKILAAGRSPAGSESDHATSGEKVTNAASKSTSEIPNRTAGSVEYEWDS